MSTSLFIIFESGIKGKSNLELAECVLPKIKALNHSHTVNVDGSLDIEWSIQIDPWFKEDYNLEIVDITTPTGLHPTIYDDCITISTIYKYDLIYKNYDLPWFRDFRARIFEIVKIFGGTEIIYLSDNNNSIAEFYECLVMENIPYKTVKNALIQRFGKPVTEYKKLNYDTLEYKTINEFFLDTFEDLI